MQDGERCLIIANKNSLGNLQFQPPCRQPRGSQSIDDRLHEIAGPELDRRHINRNFDVLGSERDFGTWRYTHPFTQWVDETGLFRDWNEIRGRDHAAFAMTPTQQAFTPDYLVVL